MRSLRAALLAWLVPLMLVVGAGAATGAYFFMQHRLTAAYDQDLGDIARALVPYVKERDGRIQLFFTEQSDAVLRADSNDQIFYSVRDASGALIAGDEAMPPMPAGPPGVVSFHDAARAGQAIRLATLSAPVAGKLVSIEAAETTLKRDRAAQDAMVSALAPTLLLLVAAMAAVMVGVRQGLSSVETLGRTLRSRSHVDLSPLPEDTLAEELRPLVHALNEVLGRLQEAQAAQARFIANAAHQLRTPIAGLVTQIDLARSGADAPVHLAHARNAARRLARLAQQVLSLAAADPVSNPAAPTGDFDLADVMREEAAQWVPRYDAELEFELQPAPVAGHPLLLAEMASNLVDNATRYGGTTVAIRTFREGASSMLEVEDDGQGIPPASRERLFERFQRGEGMSGEGSGLGLAIVREIAQRHGAEVVIDDGSMGGTRVRVRFPGSPRMGA